MHKLRKLGPLDVIEIAGRPAGPYIIVFHGFGADAPDLLPLERVLNAPPGTGWIFPQGLIKVSDGGIPGRAWFPLSVDEFDRNMREGRYTDMSSLTPEGLKKARLAAEEMIGALGVPYSRLVLMGFSQGAMLATDIALRVQEKVAGLVILSGTLLNKDLWKEKALSKAGLQFIQSHGDSDALLSLEHAQNLEKVLIDAGLNGQLHFFRGGHDIPKKLLTRSASFYVKS